MALRVIARNSGLKNLMSNQLFIYFIRIALASLIVSLLTACGSESEASDAPVTVGLVTNNPNGLRNIQGFRDGMADLGYIEGETITYIFDESPTAGDELDAVLQKMVETQVNLIFTAGTPTGVAAHRITRGTDIPVVFGVIADPIAAGVVEDLMRPGGNMTGVKLSENQGRRMELLVDIVPDVQQILVPYDPTDPASTSAVDQLKALAADLEVDLVEGQAQNDDDVTRLLDTIPENIDAIFLVPGTTVNRRLDDILAVAGTRQLPVSGPSTIQVEQGALTTYGFVHHQVGIQAARIADQILRGMDPGLLPVEEAEFYLAINLQAAEAIGLEVSQEILRQAEIIVRVTQEE